MAVTASIEEGWDDGLSIADTILCLSPIITAIRDFIRHVLYPVVYMHHIHEHAYYFYLFSQNCYINTVLSNIVLFFGRK